MPFPFSSRSRWSRAASSPAGSRCWSASGEDGVDGDGVVHGYHAQLVPGEPVLGPVYLNRGVEHHVAVPGAGGLGIEGDRAAVVPDGEGAGEDCAGAGRRELVQGEGDDGELLAEEEVLRAQVLVASAFLVSSDPVASVMRPVTSPVAETVPLPSRSRKTPLTGTRPHMLLLRSVAVDRAGSSLQFPASEPSANWACQAACCDGAVMAGPSEDRLSVQIVWMS